MHYKKVIVSMVVLIIAAFGILISAAYAVNGSDRVVLEFPREIPLQAQEFILTGESESWRVQCERYDGIILENGRKRLLQDITLTFDYKGAETVTESTPVYFSTEVSAMLADYLRQVSGEDTLSPGPEYGTIWYSAAAYPEDAPTNRLPLKDDTLSIVITLDEKTESVILRESNSTELDE